MKIINEETKQEVLTLYPIEKRQLLEKQINQMDLIIEENAIRYKYSKDFRDAIDLILKGIFNGEFID